MPDEATLPEGGEYPDETYHVVHDPEDGPLSVSVVQAVADAVGVDSATVAVPVHQSIDPDGLDALFSDRPGGIPRTDGYVAFHVWGLRVVVHADGNVFVHPPDEVDSASDVDDFESASDV